ncbi:MAG: amino acid ABC transporter permease [Ruminococcaceae bacterium]|nr:amino acid ABC transporter permease [Oscillospiraceae bacterium]
MSSFAGFFDIFKRIYIEGDGLKLLGEGLLSTVIMAVFALVIGVLLGIIVAIFKVIPNNNFFTKILNAFANVYIAVIRGTPVMVQLLLAYYAIFVSAFREFRFRALIIAIIIFGINSSAYVAEIIRSGILAVDKGQMEAGRSLGLSYATTMKKIVLPQAIKNILPALGNELIVLIKETSVAGFITVFDLTRATRSLVADYYEAFVPYITLAAVYLILVLGATFLVNRLERRMRKGDNR